MDWEGGGWHLLMKINGDSSTFQYDSGHWKSTTTVNPNDMTLEWGKDAKYHAYNYGKYKDLWARWRDPHDGGKWKWTTPAGYGASQTPLKYFNTPRHICCNRRSQVDSRMEWRNSGGRFTNQGCAGSIRVAQCTAGHACTRWGFHWNNECGYGSNDAGGGIGNRPRNRARGAGDWVSCCRHHGGRNRDFDVMFMGRVA